MIITKGNPLFMGHSGFFHSTLLQMVLHQDPALQGQHLNLHHHRSYLLPHEDHLDRLHRQLLYLLRLLQLREAFLHILCIMKAGY
ncbi:hypothetical protein BSG1_19819 [Bacillus sp. SG-1]|nr:hypothetical protein BSG1_19819 [Bacillus sp. SG-1]